MEYKPFQEEHIAPAAALLAQQGEKLRMKFPLLPERIANVEITHQFLFKQKEKPDSRGMVMVEQGKLSGFLLGAYAENPFFGKHIWVPFGGMGLEDLEKTDKLRGLYAAAGKIWVQEGVLNHYVVCPALSGWMEAFFSLSFGKEHAYAHTSVKEERQEAVVPEGIVIREVVPQDADQLFARAHWIAAHLNREPVWEPVPDEHLKSLRPSYAALADEEDSTTWVALDGEDIVAWVVIDAEDVGEEYLMGTPEISHFAVAATHPEYRARGIGRALFLHVLNVAHQQGYHSITTDWRTTNLEADRYWPTYGFEPFAYRLIRRVNPRYALFVVDEN